MRLQDIEQKANKLFVQTGSQVPVPVVSVAESLGLSVHEVVMPEVDGVIPSGILTHDKSTNSWVIIVNELDAPTRKRFTIAHEVGHFLLHKGQEFIDEFRAGETFYRQEEEVGVTKTSSPSELRKEKEANQFAAALLMPSTEVERVWPECLDPADAADKFYVSEVSMTFRLMNLGFITAVNR